MAVQPETLFVLPRQHNRHRRRAVGAVHHRRVNGYQAPTSLALREADGPVLMGRLGEVKARLLGNLKALSLSTERDALLNEATLSLPTHVALRRADSSRELGMTARKAALLMLQQPPPSQGAGAEADPVVGKFHSAMHSLAAAAPGVGQGPVVPFPSICCRWWPSQGGSTSAGEVGDTLSLAVFGSHHSMVRFTAQWAELLTVLGVWVAVAILVLGGGAEAPAAPSTLLGLGAALPAPLPVTPPPLELLLCLPLGLIATGAVLNCHLCMGRHRVHRSPAPSRLSMGKTTSLVAAHSTGWWLREVLAVYAKFQSRAEAVRRWHVRFGRPPGALVSPAVLEEPCGGEPRDCPEDGRGSQGEPEAQSRPPSPPGSVAFSLGGESEDPGDSTPAPQGRV